MGRNDVYPIPLNAGLWGVPLWHCHSCLEIVIILLRFSRGLLIPENSLLTTDSLKIVVVKPWMLIIIITQEKVGQPFSFRGPNLGKPIDLHLIHLNSHENTKVVKLGQDELLPRSSKAQPELPAAVRRQSSDFGDCLQPSWRASSFAYQGQSSAISNYSRDYKSYGSNQLISIN